MKIRLNWYDKIRNFLWNGRKAKISLEMLQKRKDHGGLGLINIKSKQKAIRISWIFMVEKDPVIRKWMYQSLDVQIDKLLWKCNLHAKHVRDLFENSYWAETLKIWCTVNYNEPQSGTEIKEEILWYNSNILVGGKPIIWYKWVEKNIVTIRDILDENDNFWKADTLGVNWLEWMQLTHAIPQVWMSIIKDKEMLGEPHTKLYDELASKSKVTLLVYNKIISDEKMVLKYAHRWCEAKLSVNYEDYLGYFNKIYKCTKIVKYTNFQYR